MRRDDRGSERDADFLREAEEEQAREPQTHGDEVVRDRQAAQLRERLRDADENVADVPDDERET